VLLLAPFNVYYYFQDAIGRALMQQFVHKAWGLDTSLTWCSTDKASLQRMYWEWLESESCNSEGRPCIFVTPRLSLKQAEELALLPNGINPLQIEPLSLSSPVPGVVMIPSLDHAGRTERCVADLDVDRSTRQWMRRTLAPGDLNLCPFTASDSLAAVKLTSIGISPAPVAHHISSATNELQLMSDFWLAAYEMLHQGEAVTSSIVLSASAWDDKWEDWYSVIFPLLEESLLSAGLARSLGVVCFHPRYEIPLPTWLARHRFGHMHSLATLRRWLHTHEPKLSAETTEERLAWAGAYMRRSPHAMINVLWSKQLEAAETKRSSSKLYATNLARCLAYASSIAPGK